MQPTLKVAPALALAVLAAAAPAQETGVVFRVDTELLEIEVRVVDKQGNPVAGLEREAFTLRERGEPQSIAAFDFVEEPVAAAESPESATVDTYLYLLSDTTPENSRFAYRAIRRFLAEQWQPGYSVAMPGLPFTNDPQRARRSLDVLERGEGPSWRRSLWDDFGTSDRTTREFFDQLREGAGLNDEETPSALAEAIQSSRAGFENNLFYAGIQTTRYRDIVKQVGLQPGKKVIVLFRDGLNIEKDMIPSYRDLASEALRYRVAFYTVDTRGLVPNDDMRIEGSFAASRNPNRRIPGTYGRIEGLRSLTEGGELSDDDGRSGMRTLAELTGGRAVVNTNDFGEVFERVDADRRGYYVLGYYPEPSDGRGRFRKIRVDVDRPGVRVETTGGYFERQQFKDWSKSDRHNHLYHALNGSGSFDDFPFWARYDVFRGPSGAPEVTLSVGIPASALNVRPYPKDETREQAAFIMMARFGEVAPDREPLYGGASMVMTPPVGSFAELTSDPFIRFEINKSFRTESGKEPLRVLLRDEHTGKLGARTLELRTPDLSRPWAPSSVVLTARVQQADPENPHTLDVGAVRLLPQSQTVFLRGKPVFILYDLYNVDKTQVDGLPGFHLSLRKGTARIEPEYEGEATLDSDTIRYSGVLDTDNLEPGVYQILLPAPEGAANPRRYLARTFQIN